MTSARGKARGATEALFTVSWDDGDPADVMMAELLSSLDLRGTFYASTGPAGSRRINDTGLARIGSNHEFGNHGQTHSLFTELSPGELAAELAWGHRELSRFGKVARVVAPPKGRISRQVLTVLRSLGYSIRVAPVLGTGGLRGDVLDPTCHFYPHTTAALARSSLRRHRLHVTPLLIAWMSGRDYRNRMDKLLRAAVHALDCVHIWGHSEEVHRLGLWDDLENLLATARSLPVLPVSNGEAIAILRGGE